jgi:hypothetical protein
MRAGNEDAAVSQAKQLVVHRPRLEIPLPNVMLPPLLHFMATPLQADSSASDERALLAQPQT